RDCQKLSLGRVHQCVCVSEFFCVGTQVCRETANQSGVVGVCVGVCGVCVCGVCVVLLPHSVHVAGCGQWSWFRPVHGGLLDSGRHWRRRRLIGHAHAFSGRKLRPPTLSARLSLHFLLRLSHL